MSYSKWRLNKAEEKMVQQEAAEVKQQAVLEGKSLLVAAEEGNAHLERRTLEIKKGKAEKSNQAKAKAKPTSAPLATGPSADTVSNNEEYYGKLMEALDTIQKHPLFEKVKEAKPLMITSDGESGVQASRRFKHIY
jgi:hypothetical protein